MNYVAIAALGFLMFSVVAILEKFLLDKPVRNPAALAFYTGAFAVFTFLIFLPFSRISSLNHLLFDLLCGAFFYLGVLFQYRAMVLGDVSEVIPITGALVPIFSLLLVRFGLHLHFTPKELWAIFILIAGTVLISYRKSIQSNRLIFNAVVSSFAFALYYSLVKNAYTPFIQNFSFVRLGTLLSALLSLLIFAEVRSSVNLRNIYEVFRNLFKRKDFSGALEKDSIEVGPGAATTIFVSKELVGGVAFIIINYAIGLGNPAIVNSLNGVEYLGIFLIALVLTSKFPQILKEELDRASIIRKLSAIALIIIGLILLQL